MGTLYPGLMRLEQQGLIKAEWGVTDNNRQARFYAITTAGRRRLAAEKKAWDQMVSVIAALFEDPACSVPDVTSRFAMDTPGLARAEWQNAPTMTCAPS